MLCYKMPERIDTTTAPEVEMQLHKIIAKKPEKIMLDFDATEYISSVGLRITLVASKMVNAYGGELHLKNMSDFVLSAFRIARFDKILNIH